MAKWVGKEGLERAKRLYRKESEIKGRELTRREFAKIAAGAVSAITRKEYGGFGIEKWNDFVRKAGYLPHREPGKWIGGEGLERAVELYREESEGLGRGLTSVEFRKIARGVIIAISRGEYDKFGIKKWEDFVRKAEYEYKPRSSWEGEEGLRKAIELYKKEGKKEGRKINATKFGKIAPGAVNAIFRGKYTKFGIRGWSDFMKAVGYPPHEYKWIGGEGLERAVELYREESEGLGRGLTSVEFRKIASGVLTAIVRGEYDEFEICSWNEFVKKAGYSPYEHENWEEKGGLERAIGLYREESKKRGRGLSHREFSKIAGGAVDAITRGGYSKFGIRKWNDFVRKAGYLPHREPGKWIGEEGLKRAIELYKVEKKKREQSLSEEEFKKVGGSGVLAAINRGEYASFGIEKWNDFKREAGYKPRSIWMGKEGLEKAIELYRSESEKKGKGLTSGEFKKVVSGVMNVLYAGGYKEFGVESWGDFVKKARYLPTREWGRWMGEEGLKSATELYRKESEREGKGLGAEKFEKIAGGAMQAIRRGEYAEFGIKRWVDFRRKAGYEYKLKKTGYKPRGWWVGKKGLKKAKELYRKESEKKGRPLTNHEFRKIAGGVVAAIEREAYVEFGIKKWNDFMRETGYSPHCEKSLWTGKEGLEKAKELYKKESEKEGRALNSEEFRKIAPGIKEAIYRRKEYEKFGIKNWSDFVEYVGEEYKRGLWKDKEGLEKAKELYKKESEKEGRALNSEEFRKIAPGIKEAIYRKYKEFDIESWNDFVEYIIRQEIDEVIENFADDEIFTPQSIIEQLNFFATRPEFEEILNSILKSLPAIKCAVGVAYVKDAKLAGLLGEVYAAVPTRREDEQSFLQVGEYILREYNKNIPANIKEAVKRRGTRRKMGKKNGRDVQKMPKSIPKLLAAFGRLMQAESAFDIERIMDELGESFTEEYLDSAPLFSHYHLTKELLVGRVNRHAKAT